MSRLEVPKIIRALSLGEYAPELASVAFHVWVNPPRGLLIDMMETQRAALRIQDRLLKGEIDEADKAEAQQVADRSLSLWSELLSQGPDGTAWPVDELRELVDRTAETDPALWGWITEGASRLIREHREGLRKN